MLKQKHGETVQPVCNSLRMLNNVMHASCFYVLKALTVYPKRLAVSAGRRLGQTTYVLMLYLCIFGGSHVATFGQVMIWCRAVSQQILGSSPCESLRVNPAFFDDESCVRES